MAAILNPYFEKNTHALESAFKRELAILFKEWQHALVMTYSQRAGILLVMKTNSDLPTAYATCYSSDAFDETTSLSLKVRASFLKTKFKDTKMTDVFIQFVEYLYCLKEIDLLQEEVAYQIRKENPEIPTDWRINVSCHIIY
tara:strand:+ start:4064 stop:4489 length:426 start_codon:yes stop_codon:yes gene_type:complete